MIDQKSRQRVVRKLVVSLLFCVPGLFSFAQQRTNIQRDTLIIEAQDTVKLKSYATRYNPRKALLYAAVVPGLGQAYNKKYWKIPLVYGGAYLIGQQIRLYDNFYKDFKAELFNNLSNGYTAENAVNPNFLKYRNFTTGTLRSRVNRMRRDRDFWVIMMGGLYLLQIVDAHVDAHLKEFDLNPNLKVSIEPSIEQNAMLGRQTGVSLFIRF